MPFNWSCQEPAVSECPVSAITPRSIELVQIATTLMDTHSASGSSIPADRLPGAVLDALRICHSESRSIENAMEEALSQ